MTRSIWTLIAANALLRTAGGASGVLVGLYLADLANRGSPVTAALVGTLAATSFAAELLGAVPLGLLTDVLTARVVMTVGAVAAALAAWVFGLTQAVAVFFVSRALEGLAAAAGVPALLAHITDLTADAPAVRARVMSYFELSLLVGLALGGLAGSQLWSGLGSDAFTALAMVYLGAATMLYAGGTHGRPHASRAALAGLVRALTQPTLSRLAPIWLCMNAIVGLWLSPTFYFLLTTTPRDDQLLAGLLASDPAQLGWLLLGYAAVFSTGLLVWSAVLPRIRVLAALRATLLAMVAATAGLWLLNHAGDVSIGVRWALTGATALCVMVESGFAPAALALLAGSLSADTGRGATMGIYSFLLSLGALIGNLTAAAVANRYAVDGLLAITVLLVVGALALLPQLRHVVPVTAEARA